MPLQCQEFQVLTGVLGLANLGHPHRHAAADLDVLELILACGQSLVERVGMVGAPAVVDPVAALDDLDGFRGRGQLLLIKRCVIHG